MSLFQARENPTIVDRLRGWLARAPKPVFALYGGTMAFGAYFSMYAFRKPFSVASYNDAAPVFVKYKIALVIIQVLGYALSKVAGIKVISEMPPERRAVAILILMAAAELSLVLFAVVPQPWNIACLFADGLTLGMIWGLVFGFLEGRRVSEVLGAMLCASFIVSSGVVKSVGESVMLLGWANEYWMPAMTGIIFTPLLLICVGGLAIMPPPSAEDQRLRVTREPMDHAARRSMFTAFAPGLIALIIVYVGLTALRDFRDNFAVEIWNGLGFKNDAEIFTLSELPVAAIVLVMLALLMFIRDNRNGFMANLVLIGAGLVIAGLASLGFQTHLIGPVSWMIALGAGLYLAYTPFNALLFDRFIAASGRVGTAGFLIYVADACGYLSSVALLIFYNFFALRISWVNFLIVISYTAALAGLALTIGAGLYFNQRITRKIPNDQAIKPTGHCEPLRSAGGFSYGEGVTQLEHALQCAALAETSGASPSLIAAALLHDIGHLFETEEGVTQSGIDDLHEAIGARVLARLFSEAVFKPVALHVAAKRYLCFTEARYFETLSAESQRSLALQGGAYSSAQATAFEHSPYWREAVALRRFDDMAKRDEYSSCSFAICRCCRAC